MDGHVHVSKQDETIPGVDGTEGEIPGVDNSEGTLGMDDTTPEVDDEATPGVDTPEVNNDDTANKSDGTETEPTHVEHTSGAMNLRRQPRNKYNRKN